MKSLSLFILSLLLFFGALAQAPQKISYQAVLRNPSGQLISGKTVGVKISLLQGSVTGTVVYTETHSAATNINGLLTLEIGSGNPVTGAFTDIDWASGPWFLKTETDPDGGTAYSITGTSQMLSVPYALYASEAGNGFSGDYNDLTNKPITDGSETKILPGSGISLSGNGTQQTPYVVSCNPDKVVLTTSQTWTVPANVSKIRVDLWGGSGGGGGAGAYSYSLRHGGDGGSGGYATQDLLVTPNQQITVIIGEAGTPGTNAWYYYGYWIGDTPGSDGAYSWFDNTLKASGGQGGQEGSNYLPELNGAAGTDNTGAITGYSEFSNNNILDVMQGTPRSYIHDRVLTSRPGRGGRISGYSVTAPPTQGEAGCAIITFLE